MLMVNEHTPGKGGDTNGFHMRSTLYLQYIWSRIMYVLSCESRPGFPVHQFIQGGIHWLTQEASLALERCLYSAVYSSAVRYSAVMGVTFGTKDAARRSSDRRAKQLSSLFTKGGKTFGMKSYVDSFFTP